MKQRGGGGGEEGQEGAKKGGEPLGGGRGVPSGALATTIRRQGRGNALIETTQSREGALERDGIQTSLPNEMHSSQKRAREKRTVHNSQGVEA